MSFLASNVVVVVIITRLLLVLAVVEAVVVPNETFQINVIFSVSVSQT